MAAAISLIGFPADDPVPGVLVQVDFAQGEAAGSGSQRKVLVLANKLSSGTGVVDTTIYGPDTDTQLQTEADMIALAGAGSEAHRMFRRFVAVNRDTSVYWLFVTESAGTAASGTIVIANAATGSGVHTTWVGDEFVDTPISSGDAVDTIGAAIAAKINEKTHWPVTAAYNSSTDTVTLTAKQKGPRGNWIRFKTKITTGIATTTTATTDAFLTSGATADSNATALATINPKHFYYIVSAAEDATQVGALSSQVATQALPTIGNRQRVISGSVDTLANTITLATGINAARAEIIWSEKSPWTPAELAANMAAVVTLLETSPNPFTGWHGFGASQFSQAMWKVPKSRVDTAHPSRASVKSALLNGISPISVMPNGATKLENRVTTRSLSGSTPDYRISRAHKVTICDYFADDLLAKVTLNTPHKRIGDDPLEGFPPPGPDVLTPGALRRQILGLVKTYAANDLLQRVEEIKAGIIVQREANPTTRMTARIPLQTVDNAEQIGMVVSQVA